MGVHERAVMRVAMLALLMAVACPPPPTRNPSGRAAAPPTPSTAPPAPSTAPPPMAPPPMASSALPTASSSPPAPTAAASADAPPASGPGFIGCGTRSCEAGREVCCFSDTMNKYFGCEARAPGPLLDPEPLMPGAVRHDECEASDLLACDSSGDCDPRSVCCWHANHVAMCVPAAANGSNRCHIHELCSADDRCRTAGAECVARRCMKRGRSIACADRRCEGATPVCCLHPTDPRCVADGQPCPRESDTERLACRTGADCLAGQSCCYQGGDSSCSGFCTNGAQRVCATNGDCRGFRMPFVEGESVAAPECRPLGSVRVCSPRG